MLIIWYFHLSLLHVTFADVWLVGMRVHNCNFYLDIPSLKILVFKIMSEINAFLGNWSNSYSFNPTVSLYMVEKKNFNGRLILSLSRHWTSFYHLKLLNLLLPSLFWIVSLLVGYLHICHSFTSFAVWSWVLCDGNVQERDRRRGVVDEN